MFYNIFFPIFVLILMASELLEIILGYQKHAEKSFL